MASNAHGNYYTLREAWRLLLARKNARLSQAIRLNQINFEWGRDMDTHTEATLEVDPVLLDLFGPCPILAEQEKQHRELRWKRVQARWKDKGRLRCEEFDREMLDALDKSFA